jgi:hypothetical protein
MVHINGQKIDELSALEFKMWTFEIVIKTNEQNRTFNDNLNKYLLSTVFTIEQVCILGLMMGEIKVNVIQPMFYSHLEGKNKI